MLNSHEDPWDNSNTQENSHEDPWDNSNTHHGIIVIHTMG